MAMSVSVSTMLEPIAITLCYKENCVDVCLPEATLDCVAAAARANATTLQIPEQPAWTAASIRGFNVFSLSVERRAVLLPDNRALRTFLSAGTTMFAVGASAAHTIILLLFDDWALMQFIALLQSRRPCRWAW